MENKQYAFRFEKKEIEKIGECTNHLLKIIHDYDFPLTVTMGMFENLKLAVWNSSITQYREDMKNKKGD